MPRRARSRRVANDSEDTPLGPEEAQDQQRFGAHLKGLREVRRLTQDELAQLAGLAADTIRRLEHGEFSPSLRTLRKMSRGLQISLTSLFGGFELVELEFAREFVDLMATRSEREHEAVARLWRLLAAEIDALVRGEPLRMNLAPDNEQPTKDPFGQHVRSLRRARGMTQEVLAERCKLSADTIRRLESGSFSPSLETLRKLCNGLDLILSTLFQSFEGGREVDREIADILHRRSPAEQEMGLRMLRALFETVDAAARDA